MQGGACCIWALVTALNVMDTAEVILTKRQGKQVHALLTAHLIHWQGLRELSLSEGVSRWKARPKHHSEEHLAFAALRNRLNPRATTTFQDEAFLGFLKKVAVMCSSSTVLLRCFQRLLLGLSQRWQDLRDLSRMVLE